MIEGDAPSRGESALRIACGVAASLPPVGLDVGAYGTLLWFLVHDEARRSGATLSTDDALTVLRAAGPELGWAVLVGPGIKWINLFFGVGLGASFNLEAARNVRAATRLYLASGRRLRGHALRQELEEYRKAERKRRRLELEETRTQERDRQHLANLAPLTHPV